MTVNEYPALLTSKDKNGGKRLLYPITRADCVDGLEEFVDEKISESGGSVSSWNDLTDKPFYEGVAESDVVAEQTLEFEHNEMFNVYLNNDIPAPSELVIGKEYNVVWDGVKYTVECVYNESAPNGALGNVSILDAGEDTGEPFVIAIMAGTGTFYIFTPDTSASHTVRIYTEETEIKQLDNKHLSILDRHAGEETDLLPSTTGTTEYHGSYGAYLLRPSATAEMFVRWHGNDTDMAPLEGNIFVEFDGVTYECSQQRLTAMDNAMAVGNCTVYGGTDNGEPFLVSMLHFNDNGNMLYFFVVGALADTAPTEHTVRVYQKLSEAKYVLKEEYIPDSAKLPAATSEDNNKFLRLVDGVPTWVALTDVSQEGA